MQRVWRRATPGPKALDRPTMIGPLQPSPRRSSAARLPSRPSWIGVVAGAALVAAACSGDRARPTTSTTEAAATVITAGPVPSPFPVVSLACSAGHPDEVVAHGLIELKGDAGPASLWALV